MHDKEALQMMQRCKDEIQQQRNTIGALQPKAQAFEVIAQIMDYLRLRQSQAMGEDLVWTLNKRIRELEAALKEQTDAKVG